MAALSSNIDDISLYHVESMRGMKLSKDSVLLATDEIILNQVTIGVLERYCSL